MYYLMPRNPTTLMKWKIPLKTLNSLEVPKLTLEEIVNLCSCIFSKEIEFLMKNFPRKKISGSEGSLVNFTK